MEHIVTLPYDNKANVWIATSGDMPGLVLKAGTKDMLTEKVNLASTPTRLLYLFKGQLYVF